MALVADRFSRQLWSFLQQPYAGLMIALIGIALVLPSLFAGLLADDFGHIALMAEPDLLQQPQKPSVSHLFSFIDNNPAKREQQYAYSLAPWWSADFSVNFFRPLAEFFHLLDFYAFGKNAWLMHVHNLVWYGLLLVLLAAFYRQVFGDRKVALLALLLFAVDATHGFAVAWIANRNALMAAVFLLACLLFFISALRRDSWLLSLASALMLLFSVLSAELGMTAVIFLVGWYWLGKEEGGRKARFLLPPLAVCSAWLLFYGYHGFGVHDAATYYIDPVSYPLLFVQQLPLRFFNAVAMQFNILPLHLSGIWRLPLAALGAVILLLLVFVARRQRDARFVYFLVVFVCSLLPVCLAVVQERNLLIANIAGCAMLVILLQMLWRMPPTRPVQWLAAVIVVFHIWLSAITMVAISYAPALLAASSQQAADSMPAEWQEKQVAVVGMPVFDAAFIAAIAKAQHKPLPQRFWLLTSLCHGVMVERVRDDQLQLARPEGLMGRDDRLFRHFDRQPLLPGDTVNINGAQIRVMAVNENKVPTRITVMLEEPLRLQLAVWRDRRLVAENLAVGDTWHCQRTVH